MKRTIASIIFLSFLASSTLSAQGFSEFKKNEEEVYEMGSGAHEGAAASLGASMLGWGVGLAAGIALITSLFHQSKASTSHSTSHCD